jgi:hypothetical protein
MSEPLGVLHPAPPGPAGHPQKFSVASMLPVHSERFLGLSKAQTSATPIFPPNITLAVLANQVERAAVILSELGVPSARFLNANNAFSSSRSFRRSARHSLDYLKQQTYDSPANYTQAG